MKSDRVDATVIFRGTEVDVTIDFDGGYEPDTNAHVIEWHFSDVLPADHDALNITDDEEQAIYDQLASHDRYDD